MSITISQMIAVKPHGLLEQVVTLDTGTADRVITIYASLGATVRIFCEGTQLAGSLKIDIAGERGSTILVGVACTVAHDDQFTIVSTQQHTSPDTTSKLWVRKIVSEDGYALYKGMVHIASQARGSVVSQDDKTLLDGESARAESVPGLEVLAHEVICTHGSAIGRADDGVLWYLQSRGLMPSDAQQLWYTAFLNEARYAVFKQGTII